MDRREFLAAAAAAALGGASRAEAQGTGREVVLLHPGDDGYDAARRIANAAIDRRPAFIAQCTGERGVAEGIKLAAEGSLPIAVKSGGHSFAGYCLNDGGGVIDVSAMNRRELEAGGTFVVGPGCRQKEINDFLVPKGLLLPAGSCGGVGIGGLTLGGGYGFFSREFGLTCDHMLSIRMIDAAGEVRDSRDNAELLWACRGGGNGHFGVVTEMRFRVRPAPPRFAAYRFRARELTAEGALRTTERWFEAVDKLARNAFSALVLNGRAAFVLLTTHGDRASPSLSVVREQLAGFMPEVEPPRVRTPAASLPSYYSEMQPVHFKNGSGGFYDSHDDIRGAMPTIAQALQEHPGVLFQINTVGGAIADGTPSAYPHRGARYLGEWQSYWERPEQAPGRAAGVAAIRESLEANGIGRHYANYPDPDLKDPNAAYYGQEGSKRLQELKRHIDPRNLFRHGQGIRRGDRN